MWFFKWLLILVYVIHSESTVHSHNNRKSLSDRTISRHKHHHHEPPPAANEAENELQSSHNNNNKHGYKLRHHNSFKVVDDKFPKLKEINKRLDSIQRASSAVYAPPRTKNYGRSDAIDELKYDYDEDEDDVEVDVDVDADDEYVDVIAASTTLEMTTPPTFDADEDEEDDEEMDDGDYEDEIVEEDDRLRPHDIQAEESMREQSPMTLYKFNHYGTRAKVEQSRILLEHGGHHASRGKDYEDVYHSLDSAMEHIKRMKSQGKCRVPRPKVVNVQHVHPSAGKAFRPHCTILHRCADDTGCCKEPGTKCLPKKQELIHLYFYITTYSPHVQTQSEKLPFYNHTECDCLADDVEPELTSPPTRLIRKHAHYREHSNNVPHENTISCKCPEEYVPTMVHHRFAGMRHASSATSRCVCDCPSGSESISGCVNMKRGIEHFSLKDRKCIDEERCGQPTCEYGTYVKPKGKCPNKKDARVNVPRNGGYDDDDDVGD